MALTVDAAEGGRASFAMNKLLAERTSSRCSRD